MPKREYFTFRYAVPGYAFILLVIAINHVPLLKILRVTGAGEAFGAFLAFLSLFAGSAIGFLIAQIYWWNFNKNTHGFGIEELDPVADAIFEKYGKKGLKKRETLEDEKLVLGAISDYIIHSEEEKEFLNLARRRWDMNHTLDSTRLALEIGLCVSAIFRFYYQLFLFKNIPGLMDAVAEAVSLTFIVVCAIVLWRVIPTVRRRLMEEYCPLLKAFILRSRYGGEHLKRIFPDFFESPKSQEDGLASAHSP